MLDIPPIISYLCLGYYYREWDCFEKYNNDHWKISEDKLSCTTIDNHRNYVYGKLWIESESKQIVKWKLKIDKMVGITWFSTIIIRIVTEDDGTFDGSYGIGSRGFTYTCGTGERIRAPPTFEEGDIVTLILDTNERTIKVKKNDEDTKIIYKQIEIGPDIRYKLCLTFVGKGTKITIIDFD